MASVGNLVLIGAGGHALAVMDAAQSSGWSVAGFLAPKAPKQHLLPGVWFQSLRDVDVTECSFALAVGNNRMRKKTYWDILEQAPHAEFATIVDQSAHVALSATLGLGAVVMSQANIGPYCSVGVGTIVNSSSNLEHESSLGDFSSLGPGATTGGDVHVGELSELGIGVSVLPGVTIGAGSIVGAASLVNRHVPPNSLGYGIPYETRKIIAGD